MKKVFFVITFALLAFMGSYKANAIAHLGYSYNQMWICYCQPNYARVCITFRINQVFAIIPGKMAYLPYAFPGNVPRMEINYSEYNDFFLFNNEDDENAGFGLTDGCLQYKDADSEIYYYELESQTTFESLEEWEAQESNGDVNPQY